nr:GntR family transcriptional regulator [Clostridium guangxiense]
MDYLKKEIILGKINKGSKLPSIRELSNQFKVNPNTIQRVYKEMEREGIVYVQRGMGTFIENDAAIIMSLKRETAEKIIDEFIDKMKNIGFNNDEIITKINKKIDSI